MDKKTNVLIIEDNVMTGEILQTVIESAGAAARVCQNGVRALEMVKEHEYNVLIADYHMPDMTGSEVVKIARRSSPRTFIIGISIEQRREREFLEAGADAFLLKPFEIPNLLAMIERQSEA